MSKTTEQVRKSLGKRYRAEKRFKAYGVSAIGFGLLALVLLFVGFKMLASYWFHVPVLVSLSIVGAILVISIIASLVLTKGKEKETTAG